jgi:hypothetical protein
MKSEATKYELMKDDVRFMKSVLDTVDVVLMAYFTCLCG